LLLVPGSALAQSDEEDDDDNDKCSNKIGSAGMGFPYEKKKNVKNRNGMNVERRIL
jgi:hypothetical protein